MAPRTRGGPKHIGSIDGDCRVDAPVHRAVLAPAGTATFSTASASAPAVVPAVAVEAIHLEFKRGALGVSVTWPVSTAAACAAWLREVLR